MTTRECASCLHENVDEGGWACGHPSVARSDIPCDVGPHVSDHRTLPVWCPGWEEHPIENSEDRW